jgi:aspartate kinase
MKIYKFGGASVKNAEAFKNLTQIVNTYGDKQQLLIVVSAMGKTTNALEQIFELAYKSHDFQIELNQSLEYHTAIVCELFLEKHHHIHDRLHNLFSLLRQHLQNLNRTESYDQLYDQIVSYGELFASIILHEYLNAQGLNNTWIDSREYIRTDTNWREAKVDWNCSEQLIKRDLTTILDQQLIVTQGFLGGTNNGLTTTLGREGSDFSAAIFAYCLDATEMFIWKDVEGLLNADPKFFPETIRFDEISYQETVEMAYYGASVIHPKTIKPLANKQIPLYVKSFINPGGPGTRICDCRYEKLPPSYIIKEKQCLISFSVKDFTFISEKNLGTIFNALSELRIKINLMQNSAISLSICTDMNQDRLNKLLQLLSTQFIIHYNTDLVLFTIKNYTQESLQKLTHINQILLEQRTRTTYQIITKD